MSRFIIDIRDGIEECFALSLVERVVRGGRVSKFGKQYCYVTVFNVNWEKYAVYTELNKKSDRFIVQKTK
jgi:hypothetical protein